MRVLIAFRWAIAFWQFADRRGVSKARFRRK